MQKNNKRKIAIFIGSRANYGTGKAVMKAVKNHPSLILQTIVGASALLDHYGEVVKLIEADGFTIDARVHMLIEGATPLTMAKTTGIGMSELATAYDNLKPDVVIAVGDRFEVLAAAAAAAYMNIPLAHIMGGEISGTIDE
ncbi:MAG: hypothetical protein QG640_181, partial [Patescibacteria group bacterium]|nr:hypothetical protein [Patescibacteria group bacterium]